MSFVDGHEHRLAWWRDLFENGSHGVRRQYGYLSEREEADHPASTRAERRKRARERWNRLQAAPSHRHTWAHLPASDLRQLLDALDASGMRPQPDPRAPGTWRSDCPSCGNEGCLEIVLRPAHPPKLRIVSSCEYPHSHDDDG